SETRPAHVVAARTLWRPDCRGTARPSIGRRSRARASASPPSARACVHWPAEHEYPHPQTLPQLPQLLLSICVFEQVPLQLTGVSLAHVQPADEHTRLLLQLTP